MPSELYRTYEVLIEESVHPTHPKRGKTYKNDVYKTEIHTALRTTNDLFQDAVCYYTIMLASLAGKTEDGKKRLLNPLWGELVRGKYAKQAEEIVRRFSRRYTSCARLTGLEDFRKRFLFADELAKTSSPMSKEQAAADTYRIIEQQAVKTNKDGEIEESEALNEFASGWASILCDPDNETNVPGTGILDRIHRDILNNSITLDAAVQDALSKASKWCCDSAEKKQKAKLAEMEKKRDEALAKAKTEQTKAKKREEWGKKIEGERSRHSAEKAEIAKNRENAAETLRSPDAGGAGATVVAICPGRGFDVSRVCHAMSRIRYLVSYDTRRFSRRDFRNHEAVELGSVPGAGGYVSVGATSGIMRRLNRGKELETAVLEFQSARLQES